MKCEHIQEMISPYIDNQLTSEEKIEFESHIKECKECYDEYLSLLEMVNSINSLGERPLPTGFKEELRNKLEDVHREKSIHKGSTRFIVKWASVAAICIVGVFLVSSFLNSNSSMNKMSGEDVGLSMGSGAEPKEYVEQDSDSMALENQQDSEESKENFSLQKDMEEKIIYSGGITLQVKDTTKALDNIIKYTKNIGGFIQHSSINYPEGNVPNTNSTGRGGYVYLRVPADKFDEAIDKIGEMGNVQDKHRAGENITAQYRDIEIEIKSLELQEQRLLELLKKADKVQDIMDIEKELNRVRTEINQRKTMLKNWDQLVDYSSIEVNIVQEKVSSSSIAGNPFKNLGGKIQKGFIQSINYIVIGIANIIIFISQALPFIIIIAIIYIASRRWLKDKFTKK